MNSHNLRQAKSMMLSASTQQELLAHIIGIVGDYMLLAVNFEYDEQEAMFGAVVVYE